MNPEPQPRNPARPAPPAAGPLITADTLLSVAFFATAFAFLAAGAALLLADPAMFTLYHYRPPTVLFVHTMALGWLLTLVFGAVYQIVPVVFESGLWSRRLAWAHWACHVTAVAWILPAFAAGDFRQVGHGGSLLALGVLLFAINVMVTLERSRRDHFVALGIWMAVLWLVWTVLMGLAVAAHRFRPFLPGPALDGMHAHAHVGIFGFFISLTMAVSYRLLPMFLVAPHRRHWRQTAALILANAGLLVLFFFLMFGSRHAWAPAAAIVASLVLYSLEARAIVRSRRRADLDTGIRWFLAGIAALFLCIAAGGALCVVEPDHPMHPRIEDLYGFLGLIGAVSMMVMGMSWKTYPFLVWHRVYSRHAGRALVPLPAAMFSGRLQAAAFAATAAGIAAGAASILAPHPLLGRAASLLLGGGFLLFLAGMAQVSLHLLRPRLTPFPKPARPPL